MAIQTGVTSKSSKISLNHINSSEISNRIQNIYQNNQTVPIENYDVGESVSTVLDVGGSNSLVIRLGQEMDMLNKTIQKIGSKKIYDPDLSPKINPVSINSFNVSGGVNNGAFNTSSIDSNSYVNKKSGLTFNLYDQGIGEWANYQYDDGKDMSYRGCMLTAASCVASSMDSNITPGDFFNSHRHDFVEYSVPSLTNGKIQSLSLAIDSNLSSNIVQNLQKGNPVIVMVKGYRDGGNSPFTSGQHYMALLDISDDGSKIYVGNSHKNDGGNYSSNGWYSTNEVLTSINEATAFIPSTSLQKANV